MILVKKEKIYIKIYYVHLIFVKNINHYIFYIRYYSCQRRTNKIFKFKSQIFQIIIIIC